MGKLDIRLEIHSPGLNLHSERWNFHVLFLDEIENHFEYVAAIAWEQFGKNGHGILFVDDNQWMELIRREWPQEGNAFPCQYLDALEAAKTMDLGLLANGFREMVESYNPEEQVILCVRHHPGNMVSCYVFSCEPTPPECHALVYQSDEVVDVNFTAPES